MAKIHDVKYLGRDFETIKKGLIEFAKAYYPESYTDFNEASPGSLFIDLAAYVGDVLSYYTDASFKESLVLHAQERRNLLNIAAAFGYRPKLSIPAQVDLDIFQLLPVSGSGINSMPDTRYGLKIAPGLEVSSTANNTVFISQNTIDFSVNTRFNPTEYSIYSLDNNNDPQYYLAKKTVKAVSAKLETAQFTIGPRERYTKLFLQTTEASPIVSILDIVDSDGNTWYEVPYLAQDTMFKQVENTSFNDPDAAVYSEETPYLMELVKIPRRFITRVLEDGLEIQFGAGTSTTVDEELLATPDQIGLSTPVGKADTDASIDPSNPLITSTYGLAPSNTTLTVRYYTGGGVEANVPSNTITQIRSIDVSPTNLPAATPTLNQTIIQSVAVNNSVAASGGRNEETIEEIRQNAIAQLTSQNRAVTREDYIMRCYSMPGIYGSVAKAFVAPDEQSNITTQESRDVVANPLALNLYVLGYDLNKRCQTVNRAVKQNLKTYLSQFRMLTDSVNIRDAYIINLRVLFEVLPLPGANNNEVLINCIQAMKDFFNIDRWQINEPIVHSDAINILLRVKGVQTVTSFQLMNLHDSTSGYSNVLYDVKAATRNGITYPSLDPAIFEVRFPNADIEGRIATF